jgi:ribose transport system permease protein
MSTPPSELSAPTGGPAVTRGSKALAAGRLERFRDLGVVGILVALFIVLSFSSSAFFTKTNLLNIVDQWSATGIVAVAATFVLISGGFDLSVAAVYSIAGIIAIKVANATSSELGILIGLLSGVGFGLINGLIVVKWKVNSIIVTLASGIIITGVALRLSGDQLVTANADSFSTFGGNAALGVTLNSWYFVGFAVITGFVLYKTVFGRYIYAVGGNREATRLSGIRTDRVLAAAYALSGFAAGLAGVMIASRESTAEADSVPNLAFNVIAAVIVGGTSVLGGSGAVWRTIVGVFLLALIQNGTNLLGVDPAYQQAISGAIILGAASLDVWARTRGAS